VILLLHLPLRHILAWLCFALSGGLAASASAAPADPELAPLLDEDDSPSATVRIDLLTVGPGDHILTRAGHAALAVVEQWPNGLSATTVYGYGDTDFTDPWLGARFLFGQPRFRLAIAGDLWSFVDLYGPTENRDVYRQQLALAPADAVRVAEHLARTAEPDRREYPYHYLERTCTTEIRTLLDDVLGGSIAAQLSDTDPWTVRDYQQLTFASDGVAAVLGDVFFGRLHDQPITRHYALMWPDRMRAYLQQVRVPDPSGGTGTVPLAGPPEQMAEREGTVATQPTNFTSWFAPAAGLLVLFVGWRLRPKGDAPLRPNRLAGAWLLAWSLPVGLAGFTIAVFGIASTIPELGDNELALSLLVTDVVLVAPAVRWLLGRAAIPVWLTRYATARLVVVGLAVALRGVGVFVQEPWAIAPSSLLCSIALWWVVRRP